MPGDPDGINEGILRIGEDSVSPVVTPPPPAVSPAPAGNHKNRKDRKKRGKGGKRGKR
jgi:hypothetical protein